MQLRFQNKIIKNPDDDMYRWRELPQVSFLSRQNTSFVATKVCLSRQNFSRDKTHLLLRHNFIVLSRDKHTFVATKDVFST